MTKDVAKKLWSFLAPLFIETDVWLPDLTGSGGAGSFTYATQAGSYTRVARQVHAYFTIALTTPFTSAPTGNLRISNLPFVSRSGSPNGGGVVFFTNSGLSTVERLVLPQGQQYLDCYTTAGAAVAASVVTSATNIQGVAIYEV